MLETCLDTYACETRLKDSLSTIRLIGQIPLNEQDIDKINNLIRVKLARQFSENIDEVIHNFPTVLACYLVRKGIQNYNEGTYWDKIHEEIGSIDANQQRKLGQFFRDFIVENDLFLVEIPGARRNITPILLHGIIPKEMIPDFFEHVVYPLYRKELVNPTDESEITYWLELKRKEYLKQQEIQGREFEYNNLLRNIAHEETNLDDFKKRLAVLDEKSKNEENVQRGLEKIEPLIGNYNSVKTKIPELKHIRNVQSESLQKYYDILDFDDKLGIDGYRNNILNLILESIVNSVNDPDIMVKKEANDLIDFFYQANLSGKTKMTSEQTLKIKEIYRNTRDSKNI